jgi:tetratricopeptide (TPR) repeat protein
MPFLSEYEQRLKWQSYDNLQESLREKRFARAVLIVEGLAQRLPFDAEIRQWQAITYQYWARQLIEEKKLDKAKIYLKKALQSDPHNRSLWLEIEKDFQRLETVY